MADAIVIGGGPAGCSCASWLAQRGLQVELLEIEPHLLPSLRRLALRQDWVLGDPGATPAQLAERYDRHVRSMPAIHVHCGVGIAQARQLGPHSKQLLLTDGTLVAGAAIVLATGQRARQWTAGGAAARAPMDAEALTARRETLPPGRVLLLGAGDNAAENALYLADRNHDVVLWSRGPLRCQRAFRSRLARCGRVQLRLGRPLPASLEPLADGRWLARSPAFGNEQFDEAAALFGFEPNDSVLRLLGEAEGGPEPGWSAPSVRDAAALARRGIFLAGDVSGRLHPTIQTALADGVTAALAVAAWLDDAVQPADEAPAAAPRLLSVTGLRFRASLGVLEHEKDAPQPIQVDAELNLGAQPLLPRDDDILHVLDYRKVRKIIIDECTAEHVNLLESLIGKLAHRLMQLPGVIGVRVKIAKLEIFDDCEVAIRVETGQW